jgi:hypothetical protein
MDKSMKEAKSQLGAGLMKLAEAMLIDLPAAATLRLFRRAEDKEVYMAGWKAYDAANAIAGELTNRAYANQAVGRIMGRALGRVLSVQRFADATAGAFFAVLWPNVGLPTASDVEAVRQELKKLREEVRTAIYVADSGERAQPGERTEYEDTDRVMLEAEAAREQILRETAQAGRLHPPFHNPAWSGWHFPEQEIRNRVTR